MRQKDYLPTGEELQPSWKVLSARIRDLADAIHLCSDDRSGEILDEWAYEIMLLSRVQRDLRDFRVHNRRDVCNEEDFEKEVEAFLSTAERLEALALLRKERK